MSLSICQGLQTCLEPRTVERRVLRLKLAPPIEPLCSVSASIIATTKSCTSGSDNGSWSSLFSLDGSNSQANKEANSDKDTVYVHPLAKRPAAKLSAESLAMCTESLGCETGDDISLLSPESTTDNRQPPSLPRGKGKSKHSRGDVSFPPPLASSGGVRVRPHREGGRLVLKAVNVSASEAKFHAERSNGRLRLHLLTEREDDREGNCGDLRGELGIEKLEMPRSRCKEGGDGGDGLKNKSWESNFWVAT